MRHSGPASLIHLTGPDTLALLGRTVTHTVNDWPDGELRYGGLLTPQGKLIVDYIAQRHAERVDLEVHRDAAADLLKRLKLFRLRANVDITFEESAALPRDLSDPRTRGALTLSETDDDATRIRAGLPVWGTDYRAGEVFPTDINMDVMHGIDYKKGCFVGQEVASRMKRRGTIRKRTVVIESDGASPGASVTGHMTLGEITSTSGRFALARLRIDRLAAAEAKAAPLEIDGKAARLLMGETAWLEAEIMAFATDD